MVAKERWEMEAGIILNTPQYCELCLCICDDPLLKEGHHFWDLTPSVADVFSGYVVSAVRFEQVGKVMKLVVSIHLCNVVLITKNYHQHFDCVLIRLSRENYVKMVKSI